MPIKRLFFICALPSIIIGCAGSRPPAPVYENRPAVYRNVPPAPAQPEQPKLTQEPSQTIEIKPLQESATVAPVELQPEPLSSEQAQSLLTPEQEQELALLERTQNAQATPVPPTEAIPAPAAPQPLPVEPEANLLPPPPPPPAPPEPAFEPLTSFVPLSPAVGALVAAANQNDAKGNIQSATTTIERAIRIEPRNATLYYKLALLRLKESRPRLAEDLAKKSALLASNDTRLKKHSWLLIAKAREMQKNFDGAEEAKAKADAF
ncbi:MAG: hypothetical protein Q8N96_00965 [Methylovulum sp.]|nr:hypothetical protein [Methylovulum sp.]